MTPRPAAPVGRAGPARTTRGVLLVVHLFPAAMNGLAAFAFFLVAAGLQAALPAFALAVSVFLVHAAIGSLNDFLDLELDRTSRPEKPLVRGDITPATAFAVSIASAVAGVGLSFAFGLAAGAIALLVLAAGLAYDLWLKGTVWSFLPYGIAIPALPVWAFVAAGAFTPVLLAAFPLGMLIALALNLANTIPDLDGDTAFGIRGLAHRLGQERSLAVVWGSFGVSIVLLALTPHLFGNNPAVLLPGIALGAVLLALMIADRLVSGTPAALKRGWYLSAVLAGVLGIAWVASLPAA